MKGPLPLIDQRFPDKKTFDLDDESDRRRLGLILDPHSPQPSMIADEYAHYPWCEDAVIEHKGSNVERAIKQIDKTVGLLYEVGKNPKIGVVITDRLSSEEANRYRWDKQTHELREMRGGRLHELRPHDNISLKWYLFLTEQVRRYHEEGIDKFLEEE